MRRALLALPLPLALLAFWESQVVSGRWPRAVICPPSDVPGALLRLLESGALAQHIAASMYRLLSGYLIGAVLGAITGLTAGTSRRADAALLPTLRGLAPIPPIAWIPLLIILLGIGEGSKIALVAIGTYFVVFSGAYLGVRRTDATLIEVAQLYEKSKWALVRQVLIPSAGPHLFSSLRIALGLSWILLVAAEVIASSRGLGWLIWDSRNFSRSDEMFSAMLTMGVLGWMSDWLLGRIEARSLRWRADFQGA